MDVPLAAGELVTFGLLTLSLVALWFPSRQAGGFAAMTPWAVLLAAATVSGLFFRFLDWRGLLALAGFGLAAYWLYRKEASLATRVLAGLVVLALAAGLSLHLLPGFANPKVLSNVILSPDAVPYSKYLNFDKSVVGVFLLAFGVQRIGSSRDWRRMLRGAAPVALVTLGAALVCSIGMGYVRFEPSLPPFFLFWAWTNLFFTCMAEEAIFRGFLQNGLERWLRFGALPSLAVAAVVFGLAHFAGGWRYVALSTIAGLGYGFAMQRTGRIEAAIATHFALNATHFALFTYPALAAAF